MATETAIRNGLVMAAKSALGHPLPSSVEVTVRGNRVEIVGPRGVGKTRTARAFLQMVGGNLRVFTGNAVSDLEEEHA